MMAVKIKYAPSPMPRALRRLLRRFSRSTSGNVAIIFALSLIPLLVAIGGAVDFSRALLAQQRLSAALDAAGLAAGTMENANPAEVRAAAQAYFDANYPGEVLGTPGPLAVTVDGPVVTIDATTTLETTLLGLIGLQTMNIAAVTEVTRESKALEVVMVLDNTGSMRNNGKHGALQAASHALVEYMFGNEQVHPKLKIGLVPFSQSVNVGPEHQADFWIDSGARSTIHGENFEPDGAGATNVFDLYDGLVDKDWNGCVETRPEPLDMLDTAPTLSDGDTLWVPYFYPDEPGRRGGPEPRYVNSYLDDVVAGTAPDRQRSTTKYAGGDAYFDGPHYGCSIPPLTPLTNRKSTLQAAINGFIADGYTHIPIGLAWGWRVLSPDEPFTEGTSYDDPETDKAIILLTDGYNTIPDESTHNRSRYTAYGFVANGRLGTTDYATAVARLDPKTATLCDNVKDAGIRLYTITFQLADGPIKDLMRSCATEPSLYFDSPSNRDLQLVFKAIAKDLSNLRLSR